MEAAAATVLPFAVAAAVPAAGRVRAARCVRPRTRRSVVAKLEGGLGKRVPTTNCMVPLDKVTGMTRPLVEILQDLNKRVPDKIIDPTPTPSTGNLAAILDYLHRFLSIIKHSHQNFVEPE